MSFVELCILEQLKDPVEIMAIKLVVPTLKVVCDAADPLTYLRVVRVYLTPHYPQ